MVGIFVCIPYVSFLYVQHMCVELYSMCQKSIHASWMSLQALESVQLKQEVTHIEEERIQVLNNIEELEQKIKDLDNQMEESVREVGSTAVYKHSL